MVSTCPRRGTKDEPAPNIPKTVLDKCENANAGGGSLYTYHLDLPVHSLASNTTYANYFCALCHGDAADLMRFNASVTCTNMDIVRTCGINVVRSVLGEENYSPGKLRWSKYLRGREFPDNCTHGASYPISCQMDIREDPRDAGGDVAECLNSQAVDTCARRDPDGDMPSERERMLKVFCGLYAFVVVGPDQRLYKNPHCAACNGVKMNETKCAAATSERLVLGEQSNGGFQPGR